MTTEANAATGEPRDLAARERAAAPLSARRPVIVAFLVGAAPVVTAFAMAVLDATALEIPAWVPVALAGLGPLLGSLAALWAQANVTPVAVARDDTGRPLVPSGELADPWTVADPAEGP